MVSGKIKKFVLLVISGSNFIVANMMINGGLHSH